MSEPSIKGTTFDLLLEDVRAKLASDVIQTNQLEAHLERADIRLLEQKLNPAGWYPIAAYARYLQMMCELEGDGQPESYLFQRGVSAADRLHASGIYPQLDANGELLGLRVIPLVITLAGSIYNFCEFRCDVDAENDRFDVTVVGSAQFPNAARFVVEGFLQRTTERITTRNVQVWSERASEDQLIYHARVQDA